MARSALLALMVRITPSTGPMQGVQPKANARPIRSAPSIAAARQVDLEPGLALQPVQRQHAGQMQAEQQDQGARHIAELRLVLEQQPAQHRGAGAQGDEHEREAGNEAGRKAKRTLARGGPVAELLKEVPAT